MITFYPTISCGELGKYSLIASALLPVSSWAGNALNRQDARRKKQGLPYSRRLIGPIPVPKLPACMKHVAADCGGFVATKIWGSYRYTPKQYVEWLDAVQPEWAACMDYCCEQEIAANAGVVQRRQKHTARMARRLFDMYKDKPWVWVPTIQGWEISDYIRHATEMQPLIEEMRAFYETRGQGELFRVGIGTLCARASAHTIYEVVQAITNILQSPIHLWGVKLGVFKLRYPLSRWVVSVDSAAWNGMFKTGRNKWKSSGMTQRQWCFQVALPAYEAKIHAALMVPKQMSLEDMV